MKATAFVLSLALLLSLASASGFSACFPYPSALGFNVQNATYPGSFGNYTVYVQAYPPPSLIRVEGQDASTNALSQEISLLQNQSMLETPCNSSTIRIFSWSNYACSPEGTWADEDQLHLCEPAAAPAIAATSEIAGKGTVPGTSDQAALPAAAPSPEARALGISAGAPPQETKSSSSGITLEQILPLFAAFLAVVVISFLLLQQRQETVQIDPQEERLLSNETRAGIMNELEQSDKIPTDLSMKLGKSKATIVEHLETLTIAGFVERVATPGKKFVFYRLTQKGKRAVLRRAG